MGPRTITLVIALLLNSERFHPQSTELALIKGGCNLVSILIEPRIWNNSYLHISIWCNNLSLMIEQLKKHICPKPFMAKVDIVRGLPVRFHSSPLLLAFPSTLELPESSEFLNPTLSPLD
jgi:hypothetical protein